MSRHVLVGLAHAALLLGLSLPGLADGPAWQYKVVDQVKPGQPAKLILGSANGAHGVELSLVSDAGAKKVFKIKHLKAGQQKTLSWKVPVGVSHWTGTLTGSAEGETTSGQVEFKVVAARPLDVKISKSEVDLGAGRIVVHPSNPLAKAELKLFGGEGELFDGEAAIEAESPTKAILTFDPPDETIKRVELKLHDPYGYWAALRVVAWYAEIDHEDVEFETAQATVRPSEAPKIDKAIVALHQEVARFRRELGDASAGVEVRVYVGGYTDTVGSSADNRALSTERAQAIARYFQAHGVKVPIYYRGFGEDAPAVATDDNVDEARNRRAVYVLANVPPRGPAFPRAAWKRLQ
ncbi:MAG: OmpA family protein [Myxococcales bacterium]|nr:OmpA family protein [Myxococcales bacterium]MCB9523509.1 OmpA family protein [Myxococcales bacterium]